MKSLPLARPVPLVALSVAPSSARRQPRCVSPPNLHELGVVQGARLDQLADLHVLPKGKDGRKRGVRAPKRGKQRPGVTPNMVHHRPNHSAAASSSCPL